MCKKPFQVTAMPFQGLSVSVLSRFGIFLCLTLTLTACGGGSSSRDRNLLTDQNAAPSADAGQNQSALENSEVVLTGSMSTDSDGSVASYSWVQNAGPNVSLSDPENQAPSFTAPLVDVDTLLEFTLTITDDDGASASATTDVTIIASQLPDVLAGQDQRVVEGTQVTLSGSASDAEGAVASILWQQTSGPNVILSAASTALATFDAPLTDSTLTLVFSLTGTDETNDVSEDILNITVEPNTPPEIDLRFPCDGCRIGTDSIYVSARINTGLDQSFVAGLDSIDNVSIASSRISHRAIEIFPGIWGARIAFDSNPEEVVTITAEDSFGEVAQLDFTLKSATTLTGGFAVPVDDSVSEIFFLDTGPPESRLVRIDTDSYHAQTIWLGRTVPSALATLSAFPDIWVDIVYANSLQRFLIVDALANSVKIVSRTGSEGLLSGQGSGTGPEIFDPSSLVLDADESRLILTQLGASGMGETLAIDLDNGNRVSLFPSQLSTGFSLNQPLNLAFDFQSSSFMREIDLSNGNSRFLPGIGPGLARQSRTSFDAARQRVLLNSRGDLFSVSSINGDRTLFSANGRNGIDVASPEEVLLDRANDRYLINDLQRNSGSADSDSLIAVDPNSGSRSVVFSDGLGLGPDLINIVGMHWDASGGRVLASGLRTVTAIDPVSFERSVIFDVDQSNGLIQFIVDVAVASEKAYMIDNNARVYAIELDGNSAANLLTTISSNGLIGSLSSIVQDDANGQLYVADNDTGTIFAIDLATGNFVPLSEGSSSEPNFVSITDMILDAENSRLLVVDQGDSISPSRIASVALDTGIRTSIADDVAGQGESIAGAKYITLMSPGFAMASTDSKLISIDLLGGNRGHMRGFGERFVGIDALAYDSEKDVVFVVSGAHEGLFLVDPDTRDRVLISK